MGIDTCLMLDLFVGDYIERTRVKLVGYKEVHVTAEFNHGLFGVSVCVCACEGREERRAGAPV